MPKKPNVKPEGEEGTASQERLRQTLASCDRCHRQLQVAQSRREDSRPFRKSLVPQGLCPDCVMTEFLYNNYPINMMIDERGPEFLRDNAAFVTQALVQSGIMDPAHCEMAVSEIDWNRVVANWNLPVTVAKSGRNPYRMGESPKAQARIAGLPEPSDFMAAPRLDTLTEIGKQQYCPKCGDTLPNKEPSRSMSDQFLTDCKCGFQNRDSIWIRDKATAAKPVSSRASDSGRSTKKKI